MYEETEENKKVESRVHLLLLDPDETDRIVDLGFAPERHRRLVPRKEIELEQVLNNDDGL